MTLSQLYLKANRKKYFQAYLFIAPVVIIFSIFRIYPAVETLLLAFFKVELLKKSRTFIGLANFTRLISDSVFHKAFVNGLLYVVVLVPVSAAVGVVLASLFDNLKKFKEFFKAVYFTPVVTSMVAAAMVWSWLYDPRFGLFNSILKLLSLPPQLWLNSPKQSLLSVVIFSIWKGIGFNMVIFISGLQSIPATFYQAAIIDGAGKLRQFISITIPLLAPTTIFIFIYNTILSLQIFDQVFILTGGGPAHSSTVIVLELYKQAFMNYKFGYAASMALILFLLILLITIIQFLVTRKSEVTY
ncbi:MAG: sugar ABC transporter permease [Spirochaetota bacterium]